MRTKFWLDNLKGRDRYCLLHAKVYPVLDAIDSILCVFFNISF
jgi:hypothetical protein